MKDRKMISLGMKLTFLVIFLTVTLSFISITFGYQTYQQTMKNNLLKLGQNLAKTATNFIDGDRIDYYLETLQTDAQYDETLAVMRSLKKDNEILYLYVVKPTEDGAYYIFDTDESEERCELGYFEEWYEDFEEFSERFINGQDIPSIISNESFGWLLSTYHPIHGSDGTVTGYVGADFSMEQLVSDRQNFLFSLIIITSVTTILFTLVYLFVIRRSIISPINRIAKAAVDYLIEEPSSNSSGTESSSSISALHVSTRDELESLTDALKSMENKIKEYISHLDIATKKAETDVLTSLDNREAFQLKVNFLLYGEMGDDQTHAFMVMDLDYFKHINDTYGHSVGDKMLKKFAKVLKDVFRSSDVVARMGGDEFFVFCKSVGSIYTVEEKAKQLREMLRSVKPAEGGKNITASIGISLAPRDGSSYQELYQKADAALYEAKKQGRDCHAFYEEQ